MRAPALTLLIQLHINHMGMNRSPSRFLQREVRGLLQVDGNVDTWARACKELTWGKTVDAL
jgi:hypothetical protein